MLMPMFGKDKVYADYRGGAVVGRSPLSERVARSYHRSSAKLQHRPVRLWISRKMAAR